MKWKNFINEVKLLHSQRPLIQRLLFSLSYCPPWLCALNRCVQSVQHCLCMCAQWWMSHFLLFTDPISSANQWACSGLSLCGCQGQANPGLFKRRASLTLCLIHFTDQICVCEGSRSGGRSGRWNRCPLLNTVNILSEKPWSRREMLLFFDGKIIGSNTPPPHTPRRKQVSTLKKTFEVMSINQNIPSQSGLLQTRTWTRASTT